MDNPARNAIQDVTFLDNQPRREESLIRVSTHPQGIRIPTRDSWHMFKF